MEVEFEALTGRLEGRVNRTREYHDTLLNAMRNNQLKFQSEIRSTLTSLQPKPINTQDKTDGSVNRGDLLGSNPHSVFGGGGEENRVLGGREWDAGGTGSGSPGFRSGSQQGNWRYRKLDMPIFDGSDPDGWILRVLRYFGFYRLTEAEMLDAVVVALEGDALRWFQWENKHHPIRRWANF